MKPIKVAIDIRDLRIAKTGVKTYTEELIRQFQNCPRDKMRFIYPDTFYRVYTGRNKFFKLLEHLRYFAWKQIILPIRAWFNNADIIFCADFFVPYFSLGAKTIPVLHDAFFFEYPQHYNRQWLWLFKTIGIGAAKRSAAIITPTRYTKNKIEKLSGLPADKIIAIYEGPKTLADSNEQLPAGLTGQKYLLHVGVMEKRKNLIKLLKAYLLLQDTDPEFKLVLIGASSPKKDMDESIAITAFIHENDLNGHVILPGYVPDSMLAAYYKNAFAYIFPSINEGFGIPVLEAFANGTPVLMANNSCLPEVAGDAAISFDPFDPHDIFQKVKELIDNEALRQTLISTGFERVKLFTWENTAAQLINVFENVMEKKA